MYPLHNDILLEMLAGHFYFDTDSSFLESCRAAPPLRWHIPTSAQRLMSNCFPSEQDSQLSHRFHVHRPGTGASDAIRDAPGAGMERTQDSQGSLAKSEFELWA